jgi:hypothetical protein
MPELTDGQPMVPDPLVKVNYGNACSGRKWFEPRPRSMTHYLLQVPSCPGTLAELCLGPTVYFAGGRVRTFTTIRRSR